MKWKDKLLRKLEKELRQDNEWKIYIEKMNRDFPEIGIHLAVFSEAILDELMTGNKTLESRFSLNKVSPFGKVHNGDLVLIKKSGGPVVGIFVAGTVISFSNLTPVKIANLRNKYTDSLGISKDDEFWEDKKRSKFVTLIKIKKFKKLQEYSIEKKDRSGWVVVQEGRNGMFS